MNEKDNEWAMTIQQITQTNAVVDLSIPKFLQKEIKKTDWADLDCAMGNGDMLPRHIAALLEDDKAIVDAAYTCIWNEIAHQGSAFEATYKVGNIIINCILHYPAKQSFLLNFLFDLLALPGIEAHKKLYKELIKPLHTLVPVLLAKANEEDDVVALKALYMLYHTGASSAPVLKQTFENSNFSLFRRSYALFSLGELYLKTKKDAILVSEFSAAMTTAQEPLIRLILSIHLVTATKTAAQRAWITALINALATPDLVEDDFNELHPFIGDYDVQEYVLMVLKYANPAVLEHIIVPIIDMLPQVHAMKQETLLDTIFFVLFANKAALKNITAVRQQALLAAADVIDKEVVLVNHTDILRAYGLPTDPVKLRQLAAGNK